MRLAVAIAAALAAASPGSAGAVSAQPVALTVSPARTVLLAPSSRTLRLVNPGLERMAVTVAWRPLGAPAANAWLSLAPRRLELRAGAHALLTVRAGSGASPGDHDVLVLLTGRPVSRSRVTVQLRVAVRVRVRAPGRLRRRLAIDGLRARRFKRRRSLLVSLANRGNVTEQLRGRLSVTLFDHGRAVSRLHFRRARELYPGVHAVVALPYGGAARGLLTAVVSVRGGPQGRRYRLRL